jgi:hypothetical protein
MIPVHVIWVDTHADADGWTPIKELEDGYRHIESTGFLLHSKEGHVTLVQSHDVTTDSVDGAVHIPRQSIISMYQLDPGKKLRNRKSS